MRINDEILTASGREKNAVEQGFFTPCAVVNSLLITHLAAAKNADGFSSADLLSPACFSFHQFRDDHNLAEDFFTRGQFKPSGIFRGIFPVGNDIQQPTTNTSKKGRDTRLSI